MPREYSLPVCRRSIRLLSLLVLAALALLPACVRDSADVEWTLPLNGATDVAVQPAIAIRLSTTMSPSDIENTFPGSITVTGDQTSGEYSGMIVAANEADVFRGQTITEFQQGATSPEDLLDPGDPAEAAEEADANNTLVFLLDPAEEFKPGERITVTVSEDVSVLGVPLARPYVFSFTVDGGGSRSAGELYIVETTPSQTSRAAGLRPSVTATLSEGISPGSESGAVLVRGSQSGNHSNGIVRSDGDGDEPGLTYVLEAADSFIPGEEVSVAFTGDITSAADATPLSPYQLTFQARPGLNPDMDSWIEIQLDDGSTQPMVALLAADFLPETGAVELVTFRERLATLHDSSGGSVTVTPEEDWTFMDAVAVDTDADGTVEIVALLAGPDDKLQLQEYQVEAFGNLAATESSLVFSTLTEGGEDNRLYVADLDSDGMPEIVAIHGDGTYDAAELPAVPAGLAGILDDFGASSEEVSEQPTGYLTVFQLTGSQFVPVRNPILGFEQARKLQFADFDNDGLLDMAIEASAGSLALYRNQTTSAAPFSFRRVRALEGLEQGDYAPDAWVVFDFDTDGDVDVVSWKGDVSILHANSNMDVAAGAEALGGLAGGSEILDGLAADNPSGLLFDVDVVPVGIDLDGAIARRGDFLAASNIDGDPDGTADLVIAGAGDDERDRVTVVKNQKSAFPFLPSFARLGIDPNNGGEVSALSLLDFNGDTALDVAVVFDDIAEVYQSDQIEEAATVPESSEYSLQPVSAAGAAIEAADLSALSAGDSFGVEVYGDIKAHFSVYSIALGYESAKLTFDGFESPPGFGLGDFEPCPESASDTTSCSGFATVTMAWQQDVIGIPISGVKLGTFWFIRDEVQFQDQTSISFSTAPNGGESISNMLTIVEEGIAQQVAVLTGDAIEFEINPPLPEPLEVACEVIAYNEIDENTQVLVSWGTAREGVAYDCVQLEVRDGDSVLAAAGWPVFEPWNRGSQFLDLPDGDFLGGLDSREVTIHVKAGTGACSQGGFVAATYEADGQQVDVEATCKMMIGLPMPGNVVCTSSGSGNDREGRVTWDWTSPIPIFGFLVYANGIPHSVANDVFEYVDENPDPDGAVLYEVSASFISGGESERGSCRGEDPHCTTLLIEPGAGAVSEVARAPSSPLAVEWTWENPEAYNSLQFTLTFDGGEVFKDKALGDQDDLLAANIERFVWPDDAGLLDFLPGETAAYLAQGGAAPGSYVLSLTAGVDAAGDCPAEVAAAVAFETFTLQEPDLSEIDLRCTRRGDDIQVNWIPPWRGYFSGDYDLELQLFHNNGFLAERVEPVLPGATELIFGSVMPLAGSYTVRMALKETDGNGELTHESEPLVFSPTVSVGDSVFPDRLIDCGFDPAPGIELPPCNEIPILATGVIGWVSEIQFDLVIPEALTIESINQRSENIPAPGLPVDGRITYSLAYDFGEEPVYLDNSEASLLDIQVSGGRLLPADERHQVDLESVKLGYSEAEPAEGDEPVLVDLEANTGWIDIARSFLEIGIEEVAADPGDDDDRPVYDVSVRGSLREPEVAGDLNYNFDAFHIHLEFNPEHLELLPVPSQEGTVVWPLDGTPSGWSILPDPAMLEAINSAGDLNIGWLAINPSNPAAFDLLAPFEEEDVVKLRFRSLVPGDDPATRTTISFVHGAPGEVEQATAFFPKEAVGGVEVIDAFLDGRLDLGGDSAPLSPDTVYPATGPFDGGNSVRLYGSNLGEEGRTIRLIPDMDGLDPLPVTTINTASSTEISFEVPSLTAGAGIVPNVSVTCDVELGAGGQLVLLEDAYTFEVPSLAGVDTSAVESCDVIRVSGTGMSARTLVFLVHEDEGDERLSLCNEGASAVADDGRSIDLRVPENLPAGWDWKAGSQLRLEVEFKPMDSTSEFRLLPAPLLYLGASGSTCDCQGEEAQPDEGDDLGVEILPDEDNEGGVFVLFIRGDINHDGKVSFQDGIQLNSSINKGGPVLDCEDAADVDDNGLIDESDVVLLLQFGLGMAGDFTMPPPYPAAGMDPTADDLGCEVGN